jgi:hypothetical protein
MARPRNSARDTPGLRELRPGASITGTAGTRTINSPSNIQGLHIHRKGATTHYSDKTR